jgi:hypothetical protein
MNGTKELDVWVGKYDEFFKNVTDSMTNTYVNIMANPDLSFIHRAQQSTPYCKVLHNKVLRECGCIDRGTPEELDMLDHNVHVGNGELHKLTQKWYDILQSQGRNDLAF